MRERLTKKDVEKIQQEIEHRKLIVRKEAIEAVKEADVEQLRQVPAMNERAAQAVYDFFHPTQQGVESYE